MPKAKFHIFYIYLVSLTGIALLASSCRTLPKTSSVAPEAGGKEILVIETKRPVKKAKSRVAAEISTVSELNETGSHQNDVMLSQSDQGFAENSRTGQTEPEELPLVKKVQQSSDLPRGTLSSTMGKTVQSVISKPSILESRRDLVMVEPTAPNAVGRPSEVLQTGKPAFIRDSKPTNFAPKGDLPRVSPVNPVKVVTLEHQPLSKPIVKRVDTPPRTVTPVAKDNLVIQIDDDGANQIIAAEGKDVVVKGSNGVIVITGGCGKLTLLGRGNQIQCDSAVEVEVSGHKNTLILGIVGSGSITGNENVVAWGAGLKGTEPVVATTGRNNEVERLE